MPSVRSTEPAVHPSVAATMKPKMNMTPATRSEDVVAAGRPVGLGVDGVGDEANERKIDGIPMLTDEQGDHESAALAQLHEAGRDHRARWDSRGDRRGAGSAAAVSRSMAVVILGPPVGS